MTAETRQARLHENLESNPEASALGIENALNQSIAGSSPDDKGWGTQKVYDASGKLVKVYVFFDDKVPQNEKAAALDKIKNNSGVADVKPPAIVYSEDFETLADSAPWSDPCWIFALTGGAAVSGSTTVSSAKAATGNQSVALLKAADALSPTASRGVSLRVPQNDPNCVLPIHTKIASYKLGFSYCMGNEFGLAPDLAGDGILSVGFGPILAYATSTTGTSRANVNAAWFSNVLPASGGLTSVSAHSVHPAVTGPVPDLLMDGAFHRVEFEIVSPTVVRLTHDSDTVDYDFAAVVTSGQFHGFVNPFPSLGWAWTGDDTARTLYLDDIVFEMAAI